MFTRLLLVLLVVALSPRLTLSHIAGPAQPPTYTVGFSTYLSHTDRFFPAFDVVTDSKGFVYVSGNTTDRNFPTTPGAFQRELAGEADAFVAKFSPDGKIVFATLVGGSKREHHTGLTVDNDGSTYLVGGTHSSDFPVTPGAYDTSFNGEGQWAGDVYLAKLNPSGSALLFATFLGGKAEDTAQAVALDSKANIVVAGATCSPDFPATAGVVDSTYTKQDSFVSKLSPRGNTLLFSTSLGNGVQDMITDLAVDDKDNIYVTGYTDAADLPVTGNAIRKSIIRPAGGGFQNGIDHFLAKMDGTGTRLLYLSYLGEGGWMGGNITWARPNRLLVSGSTNARRFVTAHSALAKEGKGERDGFLAVFDSDDMALRYSTLLGGSQLDVVQDAYFLDEDRVAIAGFTTSADFPLTDKALDSVYPVSDKLFNSSFLGRRKAFVSVVDVKRDQIVYSTYFGACLRFKVFSDAGGNLGFVAETGPHGFPGTTDFPLSKDAFRDPPTNIMVGRLVLSGPPAQK